MRDLNNSRITGGARSWLTPGLKKNLRRDLRSEHVATPRRSNMKLISGEELKEKLDRSENFKLIMAPDDWQYRAKHIPGSIPVSAVLGLDMSKLSHQQKEKEIREGIKNLSTQLDYEDEIVVYCFHQSCAGSVYAYQALDKAGFKNVRRYAGGIAEWETSGYPMEGEMVN